MYKAINKDTGHEIVGNTLHEVYEAMRNISLDTDRIQVRSFIPKYDYHKVESIIEIMMGYDPNGTWDEIDYADPDDIRLTLNHAKHVLDKWIKYDIAKDDILSVSKLQCIIWDIEALLGK